MNWTGGSLTISRKAKNSAIATQKKHFTKARKKLYDGLQTPRDLDFSIFEPDAKITKAPSAKQTASLYPQDLANYLEAQEPVQFAPRGEGKNAPSSREHAHHPIHLHDAEKTTSPPHSPFNNPMDEIPTTHPPASSIANITEEADFETKKQALLATKDWCGLESTSSVNRPVNIRFEDPADRELIGKRRRVDREVGSTSASEKRGRRKRRRRRRERCSERECRGSSRSRSRTSRGSSCSSQ